MLKKFLQRFFGRSTELPVLSGLSDLDDVELNPLTVLAVEPSRPVEMIDVDNLFFPWMLGAGTAVAQDLNDTENRILRALKREADTDEPATADLVPRIPSVIPLLLRSLRDQNVSNSQLAGQVSQDAVLVAAVLKQVNSSWYSRATPVRTIEEAIAVIGQNGLRMLVASVAFRPLFGAGLGRFTALGAPRIWELAEPYGIACRSLARSRHVDEFEAFLAGMLQNVGVIVALRIVDQAGGASPEELRSMAFHASFIHYTRRLARLVGKHWEFPERVVAAMERNPASEGSGVAEVLHLADRTSKVRALVNHGALREDLAEVCLEGEDVLACYKDIATAESAREKSVA